MSYHDSDILISVVGATGAGKTTFINKATGADLDVGHSITSCTQTVQTANVYLNGKKITLIDTPGFDDTCASDAEILERIANFLGQTYNDGQLLNGLIFLQPINTIRAGGSEIRKTRLLKKLLGENAYKRVIIGTTMWDHLANPDHGVRQEQERMDSEAIWSDMIDRGAHVVRHEDTRESALAIVEQVMAFDRAALQVQVELKQNGFKLGATSVGRQMDEDLGVLVQSLRAELEQSIKDRDAARFVLEARIIDLEQQRLSIRRYVANKWEEFTRGIGEGIIKIGTEVLEGL